LFVYYFSTDPAADYSVPVKVKICKIQIRDLLNPQPIKVDGIEKGQVSLTAFGLLQKFYHLIFGQVFG